MHINRRIFGKSIAATAAAAAAPRLAHSQETKGRIELSAPLTYSDWRLKPGVSAGPDGVKHMLDACQACGWSHVYWRAFDAGRATYRSQLCRSDLKADEDNYFNAQNDADRALFQRFSPGTTPERCREVLEKLSSIDAEEFDSFGAAVDYGHQIGLKIHAWVTINEDDHGWGWTSEFAKAHPEFRWVRRDGRTYRSQLSFAFPEVRQYKLGLVKELLAYDVDGLFIDWIRTGDVRDNPQTDAGGVADSGYEPPNVDAFKRQYGVDPHEVAVDDERWLRLRAEPQTGFMRELRQATKLPIAVMVGHPWHYRGLLDPIAGNLRGLQLDVSTWADEGLVDAAIAAGYYRPGGSAENAYRALAEETAGKCDLWYYGWVPQNAAEVDRDCDAAVYLAAKRLLWWEADYIDDRGDQTSLKSAMTARSGQ